MVAIIIVTLIMMLKTKKESVMEKELMPILINPYTGNSVKKLDGALADCKTGERFPIREGIPVLLREEGVVGRNKVWQKKYDRFSYFYDLLFGLFSKVKKLYKDSTRIMDIDNEHRVLETSIGTGKQIENLLEQGKKANFYGMDISYGMLRGCWRNALKLGLGLKLVQANAEAVPFRDKTFDVVFHFGGINFFNDKKKAIEEMVRVARPGAKIYIADESIKLVEDQPAIFSLFSRNIDPGLFTPPLDLIPRSMLNIEKRELWDGKFYFISFKKPGGNH